MEPVVGSLLGVPSPGAPIHYHVRAPEVVCASGSPADFDGHGLGVTFTASFARCLLFDSRIGAHPGSRVGGHSHSNRQFSGARSHWVRNQCADTSISAILEQKRVGIAAVMVRIHAARGIAPAPHIKAPATDQEPNAE